MAHFDMSVKPKLAETALLVSDSTPSVHSEASLVCYMNTCCGGHPACRASFLGLLHFQFLIVYSMQNIVKLVKDWEGD